MLKAMGELLDVEGIALESGQIEKLVAHAKMVEEYNDQFSLVSAGDAIHVLDRHTIDSVGLLTAVRPLLRDNAMITDIGAGGGFPGVPLAIALPAIDVVLVDRSRSKCGFLRLTKNRLDLKNLKVVQGDVHDLLLEVPPTIITARAVEQPTKMAEGIKKLMEDSTTFLCQSKRMLEVFGEEFHVEHVSNAWTNSPHCRHKIWKIYRK